MSNDGKNTEDSKYYLVADAIEMLGLHTKSFLELVNKFGFKFYKPNRKERYVYADDVDFILQQERQIGELYLTSEMIQERYGFRPNKIPGSENIFDSYKLPSYLKNRHISGKAKMVYTYESVELFVKKREEKNAIRDTFGENEYETFLLQLNLIIKDVDSFLLSKETQDAFFCFAKQKLDLQKNPHGKNKTDKITQFLFYVKSINSIMQEFSIDELYQAKTSQILFFINTRMPNSYKKPFLSFVTFFDKYLYSHNIVPKYELNKISKKVAYEPKKNIAETEVVYSIEEYFEVLRYSCDIKKHIVYSIEEFQENNTIKYVSTWLYVLLHLNNAWRRGDIVNFPKLFLDDIVKELGILNLDWFIKNDIPIDTARRVITRISSLEFHVSKTDTYNRFFSSDKMAIPIATALLFIDIYYSLQKNISIEMGDPIMPFAKQQYPYPHTSHLKKYFKDMGNGNFVFRSRKMNKTVMTLVYDVAQEILPSGYNTLLLPKYMRAHEVDNSTLHYVNFPQKQLEQLTEDLFKRGEFGYIVSSLLRYLKLDSNKSIDTVNVQLITQKFGNIYKIEAVSGFLNAFKDERVEIVKIIEEHGIKEASRILNSIFLGALPSKEENIQCLFSETGCREFGKSCLDCKYSIPNIYSLKTFALSLTSDMREYFIDDRICKKLKLSFKIHKKILILIDAINCFGKDYVYGCIDIPKNKFLDMFENIKEPQEIIDIIYEEDDY